MLKLFDDCIILIFLSVKFLIPMHAYKLQPSLSEKVVVDGHVCHTALHFVVKAKENQEIFLRCTCYLNSIKIHIKQYLLLILVLLRNKTFQIVNLMSYSC